MKKQIRDIREFQTRLAEVKEGSLLTDKDNSSGLLSRKRLMQEELDELMEALESRDRAECVKEGVDLLYVVFGTFQEAGILDDVEYAWDLVHTNNMTKLGPDGKVIKDKFGKVMKPEGFQKLNLKDYF